jgi:hypothetical protein
MIEDDVIRGVRAAREEFGRRHNFNIRAMVADLQAQDAAGDWPVVSRPARRLATAETASPTLQATGAAVPTVPSSASRAVH